MSEDELPIMLLSSVFGLIFSLNWFSQTKRVLKRPLLARFFFTPVLCAVFLLAILLLWSSWDVRSSVMYTYFYMAMGTLWLFVAWKFIDLLGYSRIQDVIERKNIASAIAIAGGMLGLTACFAGGNVGNGPGWWVVVFAAILSTGSFFVLWGIVEVFTHNFEAVSIDRDTATGIRVAGFLVALGLILGGGVAGDWMGYEQTVSDFINFSIPALSLVAGEIIVARFYAQLSPQRPHGLLVNHGLAPALAYVGGAVLYVVGRMS